MKQYSNDRAGRIEIIGDVLGVLDIPYKYDFDKDMVSIGSSSVSVAGDSPAMALVDVMNNLFYREYCI